MRRTARVLSVAALAGAALATAASAGSADAAGEVSPGTVGPGGTVTVSVACEATGGAPPASIDAHSQGFEQGTVQLQQVPGNDVQVTGPAYSGTAKIAPAGSFEGDQNANAPASEWSADGTCPGQAGAEGKAWEATQNEFVAPGWKPGDERSWEEQLRTRAAQGQNEYTRVQP